MSRLLLAAIAGSLLLPAAAQAQSAREVREGAREVRQDRRELRHALRNGDMERAAAARRELREDRQELREDWRDYRRTHPDAFRRGAYAAPRGYRYAPVRIGQSVRPPFYAGRYTINPGTYRLPRAAAGTRYIRYGDDVLLINARNGRVIRVYDRFFR